MTEYLEWIYQSHPDDPYLKYLLKPGVFLTDKDLIDYTLEIQTKKHQCYGNAQLATLATNEKLEYFEGYAVYKKEFFCPVGHAFNVFNGKVVDRTWENGSQNLGVKIPLAFFEDRLIKYRKAFVLLKPYVDSPKI